MTEYEVYQPLYDGLIEPIVCRTKEEADALVVALEDLTRKSVGMNINLGWTVREVEAGNRPVPKQAEIVTPILVDELRRLMSKHGQDLMVSIAWNHITDQVNVTT